MSTVSWHYIGGSPRVPTAQGKWPNKFPVRETQGIWKFCQNTGKTQGIWFAEFVNSLIPKVRDISILAAKIKKNVQFIFEGG